MKIFALAFLTLILTSCEYEAQLTFKVKNTTTSPIIVISEYEDLQTKTSTFIIAPNDETIIAVIGKGLSAVRHYKEKGEKLSEFSMVDIYKLDSTKSVTDFLKTDRWIYDETSNHSADYKLTVLPTDF